ncbi:MAG: response regulator transcription factor [Gammaproteobacteria bacterium]|nr:response regulator transcription factor [Gammaproteobacteria bacterium]
MPHILVVDDEELIRGLLERILKRDGYDVTTVADGPGFLAAMENGNVDLVLLDVRLGRDHGFDLARVARERHRTPLIFVTGDTDMSDKITGLELGAEDYITKPFDQRELLARIRVVLRRQEAAEAHSQEKREQRKLAFAGFTLDLAAHELRAPAGDSVELTGMELAILACLAQRPREALSRDDISQAVSGRMRDRRDRTIDVVVSKLRRKLEQAAVGESDLIQTVRGVGYKFMPEVETV